MTRSRLSLALWLIASLATTGACGDEEDSGDGKKPTPPSDAQVPRNDSGEADGGGGGDAGLDSSMAVLPPDNTLPALPPPDTDSGAPPGAQFFGRQNPVIYINDYPRAVYTDAYIYALAANREIQLRGVITSGIDCKCNAGDNYPTVDAPGTRMQWINAARDAGFQNIPDTVLGTQGPSLVRPDSGVVAETARIPSAGADLIIAEAKKATAEVPLLIVCGAAITTLADAYLKDPTITRTIVVSWLAGSYKPMADPPVTLDDYNGQADRWASEIVLRNFRVFVFPTGLDSPLVTEDRMTMEFPDSPLRTLLFDSGYFEPDHDADGSPAVTIMRPDYMKQYERRAMTGGLSSEINAGGNIWLLKKGDSVLGGDEFFRALNKAYRGGM